MRKMVDHPGAFKNERIVGRSEPEPDELEEVEGWLTANADNAIAWRFESRQR